MLEFDASTHSYTLGGRRLPSVTEVLSICEDYSRVPRAVLEAAADFGRHVHEACDLYDRRQLDWSTLDPNLVPYVSAWRDFMKQSGAVVIASESRVYHRQYGYAGSPDKLIVWNGTTWLPDIKSTAVVPITVGAQTAAYAKAHQSMHGGKEPRRCCIHLKSGQYTVHKRTDPADWSLFLSALNIHKFREKHYGSK